MALTVVTVLTAVSYRGGVLAQAQPPAVATDKTGYLVGDTVAISGSGFAIGEAVDLQVTGSGGALFTERQIAGISGGISTAWTLPEDAGNSFTLSAAGATTGPVPDAPFGRIATVQTDKYDYLPGDTVNITGAGFRAGESVTIDVAHSNGLVDGHQPVTVDAAADGTITATWAVHPGAEGSIFRVTATGTASHLTATTTFTDPPIRIVDDRGADDLTGQKDLNFLEVDYAPPANPTGYIGVSWGWDDTAWSGNNTGDACALFDTDANGFANYAVCVTVGGSPATLSGTERLYACGNGSADRCDQPNSLVASPLTTVSASVVANSDPFGVPSSPDYVAAHASGNTCGDRPGCYTADTVANLTVALSEVGGGVARLTNVCSFPSQVPNSAPSECVISPNSGFLTIVKAATPSDSTQFTFNASAAATNGDTSWTITGSGSARLIPFAATSTLDLTEAVPSGWNLTGASCAVQTNPTTGTGTSTATGIDNITIQAGLETVCTFTNAKQQGAIQIQKNTVGGIAGTTYDFGFTPSGFNGGSVVTLTTTGVNGSQTSTTYGGLAPGGTYSVSETSMPAGWTLDTGATCTNGTTSSTPNAIVVEDGKTTVCTFTNTENQNRTRGKIVISKTTNPSDATTSFSFSRSPGSPFTLTGGSSQTDAGLTPGAYTVTEGALPAGWNLTNLSCSVTRTDSSDPNQTTGSSASINLATRTVSIVLAAGDTVTCTYTNTALGSITVVKNTLGGDGTFSFTSNFGVSSIQTTGGTGSQAASNLAPGAYNISETVPAGWDQTSATCTGTGNTPASITLGAGQAVTCTFENTKKPTLTLVKVVTNDNGGTKTLSDFPLTADGTGANDLTGVSGTPAVTNVPVNVDTFALSEPSVTGYAASAWSCTAGTLTGSSLTLTAGQNAVCTITNDDIAPKLTLVKTVVNDNGGTKVQDDFARFIDGTPVAWGTAVTLNAGAHTASETALAGYAASAWGGACAADGTITLAVGDDKTCTITNDDIAPKLTLVKTVVNDNGGTKVQDDFARFIDGTPVAWGTAVTLNAGAHTASETALAGYAASAWGGACAADGTITLAVGDDKTCTITNNDIAPKLTLVKTVVNDDGGTKVVSDFVLKVDGTAVTSGAATTLSAGAHTASEVNLPGYAASGWGGACAADGSVTLLVGDDKTCTITNDDIAPRLTLVKTVVNNNGGTKTVGDFPLFINGAAATSGTAYDQTANVLLTASETNLAGYAASTWGGDCAANGTITLLPGDTKTCTITNDDIAPRLTLVKTVVNNNGGTAVAANFTLSANGPTPISGAGGATSGTTFSAGTYALGETGQGGYSASAWSCVGGTQSGSDITVALGESATCSITNDDQPPSLTLVKQVVNDNGGTAAPTAFVLTANGGTAGTLSGAGGATSDASFRAGTYALSETTSVAGYAASAWACVGGTQTGSSITVGLGQAATCTIVNDDIAPRLTLKKVVVGGSATASDFTLTAAGPTGFSGAGPTVANGASFDAGTYSLSETGPSGYAATPWSCTGTGAQNGNSIALGLGQAAECTVTNYAGSFATNSSLCVFDRDTSLAGQQFREIFSQDVQNFPSFKMTSTNPGQFFYNVFYSGAPGSSATFNITLPYPFVTQGAQPIHAYSSVSTTTVGGETCFLPAGNFYNAPQPVTLANYSQGYQNAAGGNSVGTYTFPVTVTVPATGFVYLNMHLDYGLKGSLGYGNSNNNAVKFSTMTTALEYLIPDLADHTFSVSGAQNGSSTTENQNAFKRNPGVGGLVRSVDTGSGQTPLAGATVTLKKGSQAVGAAVSDEDGWYQITYKHTGKEAAFSVTLSNVPGKPVGYTQTKTVTLKANAYFNIDFDVP